MRLAIWEEGTTCCAGGRTPRLSDSLGELAALSTQLHSAVIMTTLNQQRARLIGEHLGEARHRLPRVLSQGSRTGRASFLQERATATHMRGPSGKPVSKSAPSVFVEDWSRRRPLLSTSRSSRPREESSCSASATSSVQHWHSKPLPGPVGLAETRPTSKSLDTGQGPPLQAVFLRIVV